MHPRLEELGQYLDDARAELRRAVDSVQERDRATPPPDGGWSVVAVLEHLATVESRIAALIAGRIAAARAGGLGPDPESTPIVPALGLEKYYDRSYRLKSPAGVSPAGDGDTASCWSALEQSRIAMRSAVAQADGLALAEITAPHPLFGVFNLYEWIGFVGAHERRHAGQIREIGASLRGCAD